MSQQMPQSTMTSTVSKLLEGCKCPFVKQYCNHDMSVFTVPGTMDRWISSIIGVLPVLCLTVILAADNTPRAVNDGEVNSIAYNIGIWLLAAVVPLVMICYIASTRMHGRRDYILGGPKYMSILFGLLSILRMANEIIR